MLTAQYLASRRSILPGRQSVTYAVGSAFTTTATIADAVQKPLDISEYSDAGVQLGQEACKWVLWKPLLDAASITAPKPGDKITDSESVVWLVQHVAKSLLRQKITLYCVRGRG